MNVCFFFAETTQAFVIAQIAIIDTAASKMLPRTKREFWSIGLSKKKAAYPTFLFSNFSFNNDRSMYRKVTQYPTVLKVEL